MILSRLIVAFGLIIMTMLIVFIFAGIAALPVMWLWNWLIASGVVFGVATPVLNFWQSFGLLYLCGLLFKSTLSSSKS